MALFVRDEGAFRFVREIYVKHLGQWEQPTETYLKKDGVWELVHKVVTISSNTNNANLSVLAGNPTGNVGITLIINSGVVISSNSASSPALTIGGLTSGSRVALINNGQIRGRGGNGGAGAVYGTNAQAGLPGGTALLVQGNVYMVNNGVIIGGGGGGGGSGYTSVTTTCFLPGTKISTPNGLVNIEDLKVGDIVTGFRTIDEQGKWIGYPGILVEATITQTFKHHWEESGGLSPLLIIKHEHGVLTTTVNHEILTPDCYTPGSDQGFCRADALEAGDTIFLEDGTSSVITEIVSGEPYEYVYNLEVDQVHTYIADNVRVHNGTVGGGKGSTTTTYSGAGGGGGAGINAGNGGGAGSGADQNGTAGQVGTSGAGGAGGTAQAGNGGQGGAPGQPGASGGGGTGNRAGGAAGPAIIGNVNILWVGGFGTSGSGGTITGPIVE